MIDPLVSVILPTRNRAELLPMSAGSVLAQSFRNLELIVVDDGSEEDIEAAVRALDDPRAICIRRSVSGGPAAARNTGLSMARGEYVAFQDSDDEWLLDKLALQLAELEKVESEAMCICGLVRQHKSRLRQYIPPLTDCSGRKSFATIASRPIAYTQTWLVPRVALMDAGGFDERFRVWEDFDLLLRLSQILYIRTTSMPLVLSTQWEDSITNDNNAAFYDAMTLILQKHEHELADLVPERAGLLYTRARLSAKAGKMSEARQGFWSAITCSPLRWRYWVLFAVSMFGQEWILKLLEPSVRSVEGRK